MTNAENEVLHKMQKQIRMLIAAHANLQQEYQRVSQANEELEQSVQLQRIRIQQLEQHNQSQKMARAIGASGDDIHATKLKINRMVREIDKCIALLNR
ncbi:MAG: hypothetical protein RIS47_32 [Bacteroidota bacterium]|jgi:hypothetical protein